MTTLRVPSQYRTLLRDRIERLVRDTLASSEDWHTTDDPDPEREVVIRVSLEKKPARKPIQAKGKRRFPKGEDPEYLGWIRACSCAVTGRYARDAFVAHRCDGPIEAHHVKTRGAGGTDRDTIPLCRKAHDRFHSWGRLTFAARYGLKYDLLIARYNADYERQTMQTADALAAAEDATWD